MDPWGILIVLGGLGLFFFGQRSVRKEERNVWQNAANMLELPWSPTADGIYGEKNGIRIKITTSYVESIAEENKSSRWTEWLIGSGQVADGITLRATVDGLDASGDEALLCVLLDPVTRKTVADVLRRYDAKVQDGAIFRRVPGTVTKPWILVEPVEELARLVPKLMVDSASLHTRLLELAHAEFPGPQRQQARIALMRRFPSSDEATALARDLLVLVDAAPVLTLHAARLVGGDEGAARFRWLVAATDASDFVRAEALRELLETESARELASVKVALGAGTGELRMTAMEHVLETSHPEAVSLVAALELGSNVFETRLIARVIAKNVDVTYEDKLVELMAVRDEEVMLFTTDALGRVGTRRALPTLHARAKGPFENDMVKGCVLDTIEKIEKREGTMSPGSLSLASPSDSGDGGLSIPNAEGGELSET